MNRKRKEEVVTSRKNPKTTQTYTPHPLKGHGSHALRLLSSSLLLVSPVFRAQAVSQACASRASCPVPPLACERTFGEAQVIYQARA